MRKGLDRWQRTAGMDNCSNVRMSFRFAHSQLQYLESLHEMRRSDPALFAQTLLQNHGEGYGDKEFFLALQRCRESINRLKKQIDDSDLFLLSVPVEDLDSAEVAERKRQQTVQASRVAVSEKKRKASEKVEVLRKEEEDLAKRIKADPQRWVAL